MQDYKNQLKMYSKSQDERVEELEKLVNSNMLRYDSRVMELEKQIAVQVEKNGPILEGWYDKVI